MKNKNITHNCEKIQTLKTDPKKRQEKTKMMEFVKNGIKTCIINMMNMFRYLKENKIMREIECNF